MSLRDSYTWTCSACSRLGVTRKNRPPTGWAWAHYYSDRLKAPTTLLGCSADHAQEAAKKQGRVTKLEVVA